MTVEIKLKTPKDIKLLNDVACEYDDKMFISGTATYIDARSILALFSLIGKKVNLVFPDHSDISKISRVVKKLAVLV